MDFWRSQVNKWRAGSDDVQITLHSIYKGHFKVTYRGVTAFRSPFDYVIYQMILCQLKPDLVIEIGTHDGGSTLYLADLMNTMNHGIIHTIDVENKVSPLLTDHPRIRKFTDGWENYDIRLTSPFSRILVIDDGSHLYKQTLQALRKFSPVVSPGSYYIVEDGIVDALGMTQQFDGGPLRAIHEFLDKNPQFTVDRSWCDFFGRNATFNVNGYLRRRN